MKRLFFIVKSFWRRFLDILLPPQCPVCRQLVEEPYALCPDCFKRMRFIVPPVCRVCGRPFVYLPVGGESLYVPADRKLLVKKGDKVESGDILTDGMPNMREIVEEKGIGEGRRLFVDSLRTLLQESGAATQRKNIEALARGFINRVQITQTRRESIWKRRRCIIRSVHV